MERPVSYKIRKGLDLPINGAVKSNNFVLKECTKVAVTGVDYAGMKPTMLVKEGDSVKTGQPLFSCKKNVGLTFTSPATGVVKTIQRGDKRVFQNMVIELAENNECVTFKAHQAKAADQYSVEEVKALLLESGAWSSLRQRPFEKVAEVNGSAHAIFINAGDTNPLAPSAIHTIDENLQEFDAGVKALSKLSQTKTYVCFANERMLNWMAPESCEAILFEGPHPAGNAGTHIHFLAPASAERVVWHVGYQDVIAIGHLILTGELKLDRTIALAGPYVKQPKLIKTRVGACISEITQGEIKDGARVISGSVLNGLQLDSVFDYLTHYVNQITAIEEDKKRELLGWQSPGFNKFSTKNIYVSGLMPGKTFDLGSSTHGSKRAMVPIGMFEDVMPMDILPTQLLRSLVARDLESAQELGCLELSEEDLALCTFVSPGKVDFGPILRENLDVIEREG